MINLTLFISRLQTFGRLDYASDFDGFWKWKVGIETRNEHILDDNHRAETYRRLCSILPKWLTYRGAVVINWRQVLEDSLARISEAYDQTRSYNLLQFSKVPNEPLKLIWEELGRVKEENGLINQGGWYSIVAVTKPLMFLWGQTLAFDSIVRTCAPHTCKVPQRTRWSLEEWKNVMESFQEGLRRQAEDVGLFIEVSREKYQTDSVVPFGHFLDLYY
jgi:hypothetical protein